MANDRMYMRCRACGDKLVLGSHTMTGWYKVPTGDALETWMEKHAPLYNHEGEYDKAAPFKDGHAVFEIRYESDDDKEPQPIKTAPLDKWVLLWWTPIGSNPSAECWIKGQVSSHRPGKYWDGQYGDELGEEGYKDLARITHWTPLPDGPAQRRAGIQGGTDNA